MESAVDGRGLPARDAVGSNLFRACRGTALLQDDVKTELVLLGVAAGHAVMH